MSYFEKIGSLLSKIELKDAKGTNLIFDKAISDLAAKVKAIVKKNNKVILVGNGGSASIASHISADLLKNCKISAIVFNDAGLLTCLSNDFGYEYVFAKPLEVIAKKGDILFAISSSGRSKNILNAVKSAKKRKLFIVTVSGFSKNNPLRKMGNLNFYVPSGSYGYVEVIHLAICHCIIDRIFYDL